MKQVKVKTGIDVWSPWYNIDQAAAYCGTARSTFTEKAIAGGLPCHGDADNKRYQEEELDRFIANGFRFPGTETAAPGATLKRRRFSRYRPAVEGGLVDPKTGKVYGGVQIQTTKEVGDGREKISGGRVKSDPDVTAQSAETL